MIYHSPVLADPEEGWPVPGIFMSWEGDFLEIIHFLDIIILSFLVLSFSILSF